MKVILFSLDFGNDGGLERLPVLLLNHDLSLRIHFLMSLVIFFIFVEHDSVLVGRVDNLDILPQLGLLSGILLFRL